MATKKITEVDVVTNISDNDFYFINQGGALKQIKKTSVPKPAYTANEVGAIDKNYIATLEEIRIFLGN